MTIRNLDTLFAPSSIAVLGASESPDSAGGTVWRNLRESGFSGRLYPVNPKHAQVDGFLAYARVAKLPEPVDLAIICTPPRTVPSLVAQLGACGTRAAIVATAGLSPRQKQAMLNAAQRHTLRILGAGSVGIVLPHERLNASYTHIAAHQGDLAFVSQSGALVSAMLDWAESRGIGFSHVVSLGDSADIDIGDMLDFLGSDPKARAILLHVESIGEARKFMSAARAAARNKPVILVKSGRSAAGGLADARSTEAVLGSDAVVDAAIARAGMLRVTTLHELFLAAETLARFRTGPSESLMIVSNSGGAGVMAADAAEVEGVPLATLSDEVLSQLDGVLPPHVPRANPLDIMGNAPAERYVQVLKALSHPADNAAVLVIHAPSAAVVSTEIAQALLTQLGAGPQRMLGCWLGASSVVQARQTLRQAGMPDFNTPEEAVRAFSMLRTYRLHQTELMQTPPARAAIRPVDHAGIRTIVDAAMGEGREHLTEPEAKALLAAAGLPVVTTRVVGPEIGEVQAAAALLGYPVALKILSDDIIRKSDVGGVRLNIGSSTELAEACRTMLVRVSFQMPEAQILGFTVQSMVRKKHAHELLIGARVDPLFGPYIEFGHGGLAGEVVADCAVSLPPLNTSLALAQIQRTRVARLLAGYRGEPPADMDAIAQVLVVISQLLADVPELAELHINPLQVNHEGVVVLDAGVRLSSACPSGARRFSIQPYPVQLVETIEWRGQPLTLRPIRPEDEAQHLSFLSKMSPEDIRMRIFHSRRSIEHTELARLTQIDYAREMAFVATRLDPHGREETLGAVRATIDPDNDSAEFGVLVRSDIKGGGLGRRLMCKMIDHLRAIGCRRLVGTVLSANTGMLQMAQSMGFTEGPNPDDPTDRDVRFIELLLQTPLPA